MKKIASLLQLFFTLLFTTGYTQSDLPVNVFAEKVQDSVALKVSVIFSVDSNWIVYDSIAGEDGPIPISFQLMDSKGKKVNYQLRKPNFKKKYDDLFMMDIFYFEDSARYEMSLPTSLKGESMLTIDVEYMSCNLTTGVCMPPANKLLKIEMQ